MLDSVKGKLIKEKTKITCKLHNVERRKPLHDEYFNIHNKDFLMTDNLTGLLGR